LIHREFIAFGYDGARNARYEEHPVGQKQPGRKAEPLSKRRIAWPRWTGFRGKTVWDWLQLLSVLAIPVVLAAAGFYFEAQLDQRQRQIENQRAEVERTIEEQRAQDAALQAYLDQPSQLLLEKGLRNAQPDDAVSVVTRARTLTILDRVDGARKRSVLLFLYESGLIYKGNKLVVDLSGTELNAAHLPNVDLSSPTYSYSEQLRNNDQTAATLPDVDLSDAKLRGAVLTGADLSGPDLSGADLTNALVTEEQLYQAKSLEGATMPNGQKYEEWLKSKGRGEDGENSVPP
jgi:uncharacterized protein YjbI with pentapeptide repeats